MKVKANKIMLGDGFPSLPDFDAMETGEVTKEDVYATQDIIAHVQKTLKADKDYTSGESFIYNGVLYHATASIAKDANIVLTGESANATTSSGIQAQINEVDGKIDAFTANITLNSLPVKIGKSFAGKDLYLTYHKVNALPDTDSAEVEITEIPDTANVLFFTAIARDNSTGNIVQIPTISRAGASTLRADYGKASKKIYINAFDNKSNFSGEFYFVYEYEAT